MTAPQQLLGLAWWQATFRAVFTSWGREKRMRPSGFWWTDAILGLKPGKYNRLIFFINILLNTCMYDSTLESFWKGKFNWVQNTLKSMQFFHTTYPPKTFWSFRYKIFTMYIVQHSKYHKVVEAPDGRIGICYDSLSSLGVLKIFQNNWHTLYILFYANTFSDI